MMRRLIQNPAHRPCRRTASMKKSIGSCRSNDGDAAVRSHLGSEASVRARFNFPYILPSSRGFEIEGVVITIRQLSTLNKEPTPTDLSISNAEKNTGGIEPCGHVEEELDINDTAASISEEEILRESQSKEHANEVENEKLRMSCNLGKALKHDPYRNRGYNSIIKIFEEARCSPHELLENKHITSIFYYLVKTDVSAGYDVLKFYVARCKMQGRLADLNMYQILIHRIRSVELYNASYYKRNTKTRPITLEELHNLVRDITQHIQEEYSDGKKMVYQYLLLPELVLSLSCHRNFNINRCAKPVMEYILDAQFPQLNPELYEHMMGLSTQSKTGPGFLPYHRVLSQLVSNGHRPKPESVINLLHCYQPFNDTETTHEVLSIIKRLHPDDVSSPPAAAEDYRIDLGTLESISMASVRTNSIDLQLLVWDMVELFDYNPTESMFEDVIMSFAATKQDENVFSALVDMEESGFVPSQVLLRYVALKVEPEVYQQVQGVLPPEAVATCRRLFEAVDAQRSQAGPVTPAS